MIKAQTPWAEEIEQYGEIDFDKLLYLLTSFRNIPQDKWDDFDDLEGLIDRLGQGNLTTLMRKVRISINNRMRTQKKVTSFIAFKKFNYVIVHHLNWLHIMNHQLNEFT